MVNPKGIAIVHRSRSAIVLEWRGTFGCNAPMSSVLGGTDEVDNTRANSGRPDRLRLADQAVHRPAGGILFRPRPAAARGGRAARRDPLPRRGGRAGAAGRCLVVRGRDAALR